MQRCHTMDLEHSNMLGRAIADMLLKAIPRIFSSSSIGHVPIACHLGDDAGCTDSWYQTVSSDHRLGARILWQEVIIAVNNYVVCVPIIESLHVANYLLHCLLHSRFDSRRNTTYVNSLWPDPADTDGGSLSPDDGIQLLALQAAQLFGIIKADDNRTVIIQHDRSSHERSGPTAASYLIESDCHHKPYNNKNRLAVEAV